MADPDVFLRASHYAAIAVAILSVCDIIFQLLGVKPQDPHLRPWTPLGDFRLPEPLTQLDTPNYQILENTLYTSKL